MNLTRRDVMKNGWLAAGCALLGLGKRAEAHPSAGPYKVTWWPHCDENPPFHAMHDDLTEAIRSLPDVPHNLWVQDGPPHHIPCVYVGDHVIVLEADQWADIIALNELQDSDVLKYLEGNGSQRPFMPETRLRVDDPSVAATYAVYLNQWLCDLKERLPCP